MSKGIVIKNCNTTTGNPCKLRELNKRKEKYFIYLKCCWCCFWTSVEISSHFSDFYKVSSLTTIRRDRGMYIKYFFICLFNSRSLYGFPVILLLLSWDFFKKQSFWSSSFGPQFFTFIFQKMFCSQVFQHSKMNESQHSISQVVYCKINRILRTRMVEKWWGLWISTQPPPPIKVNTAKT